MPDVTPPVRWQPDRTAAGAAPSSAPDGALDAAAPQPVPTWFQALSRGALGRCPACGQSHAFQGYLKVVPECGNCGAPLGQVRADDAPPYFTIFVVGHLVVPLIFWADTAYHPSVWTQVAIWVPVTLILSLVLLRPFKGATLGLMLKLGFLKAADE